MGSKITALVLFFVLYLVLISISSGDQPPGVELNLNGVSKILWMFDTPQSDWINTKSMGQVGHEGDDFYSDDWSKANAEKTVKGQIAYAGISGKAIVLPFDSDGYGNHVVIYDSSLKFALRYAHLDKVLITDGQDVIAGITPIGEVGNTGNVAGPTGYHLHIVLYKNVATDKGRPVTTITFNRPNKYSIGPPTSYAAPFLYNPRATTGNSLQPPDIISPGTASEPGEQINTLTPIFKWNPAPNAERYGLFISKSPYGAENIIFREEHLTGTSYTLPIGFLNDGVKYRWNMQAYNSAGWGNISDRLYFDVKLSTPPVATGPLVYQESHAGLAGFIDDYLRSKNSPMVGEGTHYVKWAKYFKINPLFIVAISGAESNFGVSYAGNKYNVWGWRGNYTDGRFWDQFGSGWDIDTNNIIFSDAPGYTSGMGINMETGYEDGMFWIIRNLKNSYIDIGFDTVEKVGRKWCTEGTDDWIKNVNLFLQEMNTPSKRTLTITSAEIAPGSKSTVQVNISDATGIDGGDIKIKYNPNVITIVNAKTSTLTASMSLILNTNVLGEITIAMAGAEGIKSGSGALIDIELMTKASSQPGTETALEFIDAAVYNLGNTIPISLKNGAIKITGTNTETKPERNLSITSVDTAPNAQASVQVKISDAKGMAAGDIIIKYDPNFLTIGEIKGTDLVSNMNFIVNTSMPGKIIIGIAAAQGLPSGSGSLAEIPLIISPNAKNGSETVLSFDSDTEIYDETGTTIPVKLESGVVRILGIKGDVNKDGKVSAADAMLTLRIAAELMIPNEYQKWAADMNDDGKVRTNDVILILRIASGLAAPRMDISSSIASEVSITFAEESHSSNERITVPLIVYDANELAGGDISIAYDNNMLRAINISTDSDLLVASDISKPGIIRLAFASYGTLNKKMIAEIQFDVFADGISSLSIKSLELYKLDGSLIDSRKMSRQVSLWKTIPERNALLQNFPNPFNPETWIPYQLKEGSEVIVRIYSMTGELVREFNMGYKPAGLFTSRDRAVYWNGKNEEGEQVSSGIYFYTIRTGKFTATRKMVINE